MFTGESSTLKIFSGSATKFKRRTLKFFGGTGVHFSTCVGERAGAETAKAVLISGRAITPS
jgi:hypothetical protein